MSSCPLFFCESLFPVVLVFFLIVTLFAGIGYQLRRWMGRQRWYMGVVFVLVLYIPGFIATLAALMVLGNPFDVARRSAAGPVLNGLIIGAMCLCASADWLPASDGAGREKNSDE